jgi:hypothetical protein
MVELEDQVDMDMNLDLGLEYEEHENVPMRFARSFTNVFGTNEMTVYQNNVDGKYKLAKEIVHPNPNYILVDGLIFSGEYGMLGNTKANIYTGFENSDGTLIDTKGTLTGVPGKRLQLSHGSIREMEYYDDFDSLQGDD